MRSLSAAELLAVWEQGQGQLPVQQALILLAAACPDVPPDALAALRIGRRDAGLLTLREWTFGSQLVSLAICPNCGERLELAFDVADIRVVEDGPDEPLSLTVAGCEVAFRLPNSLDLAAAADLGDAEASRRMLLERCMLAVQRVGGADSADVLSPEIEAAIIARMADADPQADVQLALVCPACGQPWLAAFDIVSFFWSELNAWAIRVLRDVHALASAYGWREADILALSPWRRQCYLEMVRG
jgi:hypothetical protein